GHGRAFPRLLARRALVHAPSPLPSVAPAAGHPGMVGAELGRAYARRGVALIDPDEGTAALLRELAWGDPAARAVVYTASGW
ncbi:hypothetical protein, partial [Streptomyces sp. NPDC005890]|uniref:hypothetical protein n=1 Tax=Streptomyces sp. NPDC005890 TaxID=3154568 RepID=UPI0033EAF7A1